MNLSSSIKWSFLSEVVTKLIQPLCFVVLARILTPEDFGLVATALMMVAFSQIISEAGLGKAVIQSQLNIQETATAGFWINLGLSICVFGALNLLASSVSAAVLQDQRATSVIHAMSLQVLIGAFAAIQIAVMQKEFSFKDLFWVKFSTTSVPGLLSVLLAVSGLSFWSIVIGSIAGQLMQVILLWRISDWRPSFTVCAHAAKKIARFGGWVTLSALLTWFYAWVDVLFVGIYLGANELGVYRTGSQFVSLLTGLAFAPFLPVMYSYFSKINTRPDELKNAARIVLNSLRVFCIPLGVFLHTYSDEVAMLVFGEKWLGIGAVISFMALMHMLSWLVGLNNEIYRASGQPWLETVVTASLLLVYMAGYYFAIQLGLEAFLVARVLLAALACILHMTIICRFMSFGLLSELANCMKILGLSTLVIMGGDYLCDFVLYISSDLFKIFFGAATLAFAVLLSVKAEIEVLKAVLPHKFVELIRR